MKTIEEIKKSVLAYCEEVCPNDEVMFRDRLWIIRDIDGFVCQRQTKANQGTQVFHAYERLDDDDPHWVVAYAVLGLEARDAVVTLEKRLDTALRDLRKECDFSGKLADENTAIVAKSAKSAKLVEALEVVKYGCEFGNQSLGCQKLPDGKGYSAVIGSPYEFVCDALEAYKKGGDNVN